MESHDEERLNYKNQEFGNSNGAYDIQELSTALDRMELVGAFYFTIPGPKMIWQFGELGYDFSINYCENGTIDPGCRVDPKPIAWDLGYQSMQERQDLLSAWRRTLKLRVQNPIFQTDDFTLDVANSNGLKRIQLQNLAANGSEIKYVTILGNFDVTEKTIVPEFQETGTWYNMLSGISENITDVNAPIVLQPGEYRLYSNEVALLEIGDYQLNTLLIYPNPTGSTFRLSEDISKLVIYDMSYKLIETIDNYRADTEINTERYDAGIYIVSAITEKGSYQTKLIKK
jgi:hypothetical protein